MVVLHDGLIVCTRRSYGKWFIVSFYVVEFTGYYGNRYLNYISVCFWFFYRYWRVSQQWWAQCSKSTYSNLEFQFQIYATKYTLKVMKSSLEIITVSPAYASFYQTHYLRVQLFVASKYRLRKKLSNRLTVAVLKDFRLENIECSKYHLFWTTQEVLSKPFLSWLKNTYLTVSLISSTCVFFRFLI